eukprot:PITA_23188
MVEDGRFRVEKFNGQNYQLWKMQMKDYLYQRGLYLPLSRKTKKTTSMTNIEWDIIDRKTLGTIRLCLATSVAFNVSKKTTIEGLMSALAKLYEKPSASNKGSVISVLIARKLEWFSYAISNSVCGSSTLKFDDVVGVILSEEMRQKSSGETSGNALTAETRGRKLERGKSLGYHNKARKAISKSRSGIVWWKCGKKGHLKKDCKSRKGNEGDAQQETNHEANVTSDVLQDALILSLENIIDAWVVDLGASFHPTPDKKHFHDYIQGDFGQVELGDDKPCKIVGMGTVFVKQQNGNQCILKDVRNVPNLKKNLISIGQLGGEGCVTTFTGEDTTLWHHRLGHMSEKGMQILHSRNLLLGIISCYYVTFIDDATRKSWIYCIRNKFDVFDTFKKWKALVENETGKRLKCLRSDNRGEYCSKEFDRYCLENGIRREKTVLGTPQENNLSERMNRTIMERARCMRLHAGLPLQFWADAVDTAIYLINRGPSSSLDGGIPEEAWTGKKVNHSFFNTFSCEASVHINKENITKLEEKSKKCTFIGYGVNDFGYRFYDYEKHKIIRSRDVIFNEKVL